MPFRLSVAFLALSVLACAGSPKPATEAAPAIQHFFGEQEEQPQAEKRGETPAPVAEAPQARPQVVSVASPEPAPAQKPAPTPEAPPAPEVPKAEAAPQPVATASARETPDAIQHFFGRAEPEVRPTDPAKDQKDGKDSKDGEKVDAFDHFFGEKPPA